MGIAVSSSKSISARSISIYFCPPLSLLDFDGGGGGELINTVTSCEKWERVGKSGEKWLKVAKSGEKWLRVVKSGEKLGKSEKWANSGKK